MALHTFEDLEVWKRASRLAVDVCAAVQHLKVSGLRNQIQRSAISVPSNIAEGAECDGDFVRFLRISKGFCAELRTQLYISSRLIQKIEGESIERIDDFVQETRELSAMLQGLIQSIHRSQKSSEN